MPHFYCFKILHNLGLDITNFMFFNTLMFNHTQLPPSLLHLPTFTAMHRLYHWPFSQSENATFRKCINPYDEKTFYI